MIQLFGLISRFTGQVYAQFFKGAVIDLRENHRRMSLASPQQRKLIHRQFRGGVSRCADGKGNEDFIGMQPRVVAAQIFGFQLLKTSSKEFIELIEIIDTKRLRVFVVGDS